MALLASVKFLPAPFLAEIEHYDFTEAFFITTLGGTIGVVAFVFIGEGIKRGWQAMGRFFRMIFTGKKITAPPPPKRKFTRGNRFIVRVKRRFGLTGIAFVTPCIISIPVGCLVAMHFFKNRRKVLGSIMLSLVLWSLLLNLVAQTTDLSRLFH